jgi:hypothetical protein
VVLGFAVESLNESRHNISLCGLWQREQRNREIVEALAAVRIDPMFEGRNQLQNPLIFPNLPRFQKVPL